MTKAALSACVAGGLVVLLCGSVPICCVTGIWNRLPRPPVVPAKGFVVVAVTWLLGRAAWVAS